MNIADHTLEYDGQGLLLPWTSWHAALDLEMNFYRQCPLERGYPRFVCETFLDGDWSPDSRRTDTIPATQNGMGIISYLKFHELRGKRQAHILRIARLMGDYLLKETLTPDSGRFPRFTRSTGRRMQFPQPEDCGSQSD